MDIRRFLMLSAGLLVAACNKSALPRPQTGTNQSKEALIVPYPPPAARAEIVPPKPGDRVVWVDGAWIWDRRRWVWERGRWEVPPKGARYAPAKVVHNPDGSLAWYPGGWQTGKGQSAPQNAD